MKQAMQIINSIQLRQFAPLGKLSDDDAQELLRTSIIVTLSPGTPLFSDGSSENQLFYLIEGKVELCRSNNKIIIESGTNEARNPISSRSDKHATAIAIEQSTLVSFDADMLDLFLNWTNPNAYVVSEYESSKDHEWLNRLLKSRGLLRFSEQQINTLLDRMNEVHFNKGDVVISQDDDDEFYYVIKSGRATVSRKPTTDAKEIKLAELGEGDAFGEESILTHSSRSATITMNESGELMRLSKKDFSELLAQPMLETISWNEAQAMIATDAELIDIRHEEQFNELNVPGSRNIPLPLLRLKLKKFNQRRKYIICCEDGSRSSVAAFLLNRHGFDAFILDGGMTTVVSQMADLTMNKFAAETDTTIQTPAPEVVVNSNEHGNEFCSLAEHWGNTVKETHKDEFDDNKALHQIEKTTVTSAAKKNISTSDYNLPKQKIPVVKNNVLQNKDGGSDKLFRNILFGIIIVFMAAAITMYSSSTNKTVTKNLNETIQSANAKKTIELTTPANISTDTTVNNITTAITPKTRFVTPEIENTITEESTTEPVANNDTQPSESEVIESQTNIESPDTPAVAIDPATRGFIE